MPPYTGNAQGPTQVMPVAQPAQPLFAFPAQPTPMVHNGVTYFAPQPAMQFVQMPVQQPQAGAAKPEEAGYVPAEHQYYQQFTPLQTVFNTSFPESGTSSPALSLSPSGYASPAPTHVADLSGYQFAAQSEQGLTVQVAPHAVCTTQSTMIPQYTATPAMTIPVISSRPTAYFSPGAATHSPIFAAAHHSHHGSPALTHSPAPSMGGYASPVPRHMSTPKPMSSTQSYGSYNGGPNNRSLSTQLEVVWHGEFNKLFGPYPDQWELHPISDPKAVSSDTEGVQKFMDSAKVRFICPHCSNCWTSMKGRVYFVYLLDRIENKGYVYFTLIGQKCSKCEDKDFVHAMWYPDEIEKVVQNVHQKVGQSFYGVTAPIVRVDRRRGQPKKPHILTACQACDMGICREEHNFR